MIIDRVDEELLLFSLDPAGTWAPAIEGTLHRALAAAWLAELMVESRIGLREGRVTPRTKTPIGDPTLDWALDMIRRPKRPKRAKTWVRKLARQAGPHVPEVMERLHGRGHVDIVRSGRSVLYPSHDPQARGQLRDHLRMVLFGQRGADDSSVALLAILDGAGLTQHVFGPHLAKQSNMLLERLLHRDHRFALLRQIISKKRKRKKA
ncbi:MAG: GPP34 family phosphoprotein [Thermoplasmatota archaeon]